jgi:tRNA(Ile)-lysidine synthase
MVALLASGPDAGSRRIETAVRRSATGRALVLAVSGGRDSMVLLHAAARVAREAVTVVATFDHGTGAQAAKATDVVASEAFRLGIPCVIGHAGAVASSEAAWRVARREFLSAVAARTGGVVATAHTRDDQVETVLMRVLRDAGARGLAGLYATGAWIRPLLDFSRAEVAEYAASRGVKWVADPTNDSMRYLRNRVRRDLLPALAVAAPGLEHELIEVSREAAALRARVDDLIDRVAAVSGDRSSVTIPASALGAHSSDELALLWPALAARVGLAMDWRGTERAAEFTREGRVGSRIPLSGGWTISRSRDSFELTRPLSLEGEVPLRPGLSWGQWRFQPTNDAHAASDSWVACLPARGDLQVRGWRAGDRMSVAGAPRRVKRFLSDAGITGAARRSWPVVAAGDEIVWIPGVRRSDAAAVRPGRPGVLYRCERVDR